MLMSKSFLEEVMSMPFNPKQIDLIKHLDYNTGLGF